MALLSRTFFPRLLNSSTIRILNSHTCRQGHWFPDYKAGPAPKTEEERIAAAKKYNLFPEEYKPAVDEYGITVGDYPDIKEESVDMRDPYYDWDYEDLRRNYNEPVSLYAIEHLPEYFTTKKSDHTFTQVLKSITLFCGPILLFIWCTYHLHLVQPILEKQIGHTGETHYTFELDYEQKK